MPEKVVIRRLWPLPRLMSYGWGGDPPSRAAVHRLLAVSEAERIFTAWSLCSARSDFCWLFPSLDPVDLEPGCASSDGAQCKGLHPSSQGSGQHCFPFQLSCEWSNEYVTQNDGRFLSLNLFCMRFSFVTASTCCTGPRHLSRLTQSMCQRNNLN